MTLARTQAYAIRQLDAIAERLEESADLGEIAKGTAQAEPKVGEWLVVLARTLQLQDGVSVLELDRVLDTSPDELDRHRLGLAAARRNRRELVGRSTARLLTRMDEIVQAANAKVLLNPFDSPRAARSSNQIATAVLEFRGRLGIESGRQSTEAKRWGQAFLEARDTVLDAATDRAQAAKQFGDDAFDRATEMFRSSDADNDGTTNKSRAVTATEEAGAALRKTATEATRSLGTRFHRNRSIETADRESAPTDTDK
jgi:hypothetical protein